ncbi:hypothetical protein ON010_g16533 [Phytophthora cinnamomi]|nr:hypothetical protein ON010_g16533 [Phytophthora cinnamomi]
MNPGKPKTKEKSSLITSLLILAAFFIVGLASVVAAVCAELECVGIAEIVVPDLEPGLGLSLVLTSTFVTQPTLCVVHRAALTGPGGLVGLLGLVDPQQRAHLAGTLPALLDATDRHPVFDLLRRMHVPCARSLTLLRPNRRRGHDSNEVVGLHLQELVL